MNDLMTKTLAQIVSDDHRAASIFEKYQLDFCCKGKRSLQQACSEKDLPVQEVIDQLSMTILPGSSKVTIDYNRLSLTQLAEYIVYTHHDYVKKEMPQLLSYLQKVASKHGVRHPEMLKVFDLFTALAEEMTEHMKKEELVLFPRIKEIEKQSLAGQDNKFNITYLKSPVIVMEQEHDYAGRLLEEIRKLTNDYQAPPDACTTYKLSFAALKAFELDFHHHVHLENNILFPKALQLFDSRNHCSLS
ncbi:MAG TPA: iron-sulfur cluster repair di-iron protein [Chitinophagaceae bacterium]